MRDNTDYSEKAAKYLVRRADTMRVAMAENTDRQAVKAVPGQRASCTATPASAVPAARSPNMRPAATTCDPACKSCAR